MDSVTPDSFSAVYLFAGSCDGASIMANNKSTAFKANYFISIEGDESYVSAFHKPGMERRSAEYQESPEWSAYFGKRTAVCIAFKGKPPLEKAAA